MTTVSEFKPLAPETVECPYPFYAALRREAPVFEVPELGFWIVSRYDDIVAVLKNTEVFSSASGPAVRGPRERTDELRAIYEQGWPPVNTLLTNDPPSHARYRGLVNKAFSARRVAQLEPSVQTIAADLVDTFIGDGRVELVGQFAVPLPLTVIADALGVSRDDLPRFKRWSDDSVAPLGGMISYERELECARSIVEFQHYFAERLEERRTEPRDDILTDLLNARLDGEKPLDTAEMLSIIQQLLVAGNETTTNMIASTMLLLLQHPEQMAAVRTEPELIANLIEEALRLESPVQGLFRTAKVDTEVGGVRIPAGARLNVLYASGNRDEREYAAAETFDVRREDAKTHLAFGLGVHYCLGAALARLEGVVAFRALVSRLRDIRLAPGKNDLTHTPSFILRGLKELHLEFDPV
jgi:cytochrome P450